MEIIVDLPFFFGNYVSLAAGLANIRNRTRRRFGAKSTRVHVSGSLAGPIRAESHVKDLIWWLLVAWTQKQGWPPASRTEYCTGIQWSLNFVYSEFPTMFVGGLTRTVSLQNVFFTPMKTARRQKPAGVRISKPLSCCYLEAPRQAGTEECFDKDNIRRLSDYHITFMLTGINPATSRERCCSRYKVGSLDP